MGSESPSKTAADLTNLVALRDYSAPSGEAVGVLRAMFRDEIKGARALWARLIKQKPNAAPEMFPLEDAELQRLAPEPVSRTYVPELEEAYGDWLDGAESGPRVLVYPPGDMDKAIEGWAKTRGLQCLDVGRRGEAIELPAAGSACVVPALHLYFIREIGGLQAVTNFLLSLMDYDGKVLIGCNSWAWSYLKAAAHVENLLPFPESFQSLDETAMREWLDVPKADVILHDRQNKRDVFKDIAIRSQGIPSVAWQMWRQGLRRENDGKVVLRVVPELRSLPSDERRAKMVLHALLVHGELRIDELNGLMPFGTAAEMVVSLERRDYVEIEDSVVRVCPLAYPTIRSLLLTAGYNSDGLS